MDFFGSQDGVMAVTNTGSNTANAVHLSGDWLTSSITYFSLEPLLAFYEFLKALQFVLTPVSSVAQKVGNFTGN